MTTQLSGLQFGGGLGSGATNWINEQSGLLSTGKMDIQVGGNTDLQAGKIISDSGDLSLSTDTLTYSDFLGQKGYEGFSAQIGIEIPGNELPGAPPANNTLEGTYQLDDTRQTVRATVGPGSITVRNEEKQAALEQSAATAPLADLNRDPGKAYEITRDKHIDLEIYLSTRSVNALAEGIKNAFAPGGLIDRYLLGKRLTAGEIADVKAGVDALVNGGEFVGCGQKQGFNLLDLFFTPAYADDYLTDCTIRQKNGEFIHLGIQTYQACQDAIYAYLNSLGTEERLNVIKAAAFASYTDHPNDGESGVKNGWLLNAIAKLDGGSNGAAYNAYLQATYDAAQIQEQLDREQWAIWNDPSTTLSEKFQKLEDTGLDMNAVIAMAVAGGVIGSPALIGNPYHPQAVNNRIRPPYKANAAHDVNSPLYNPSKTPEPPDAKFAYENSTLVRADFGTWYARGDGGYYRYFSDNAGTAHFSGTISASQVLECPPFRRTDQLLRQCFDELPWGGHFQR
ncbi:hypothetical protein NE852_31500 (plasmid) [Rhizobium sp. Pop5]|uniref:hypothetical protein n=1 Tax=Rhizobium sp. Pop5 TaxID=1223565 RepID=UPI0021578A29|nr:hypothetical protein [Rhizobium sp. Pop5]UVD60295.1 hypothetical protein NE852_31500 [Rhizobium sp. Pop5]